MAGLRIIYDFGMNNGDDLPYYLMKADKVVGVEANPALCSLVAERFAGEVGAGRLAVVNCVLSDRDTDEPADFYLHKTEHVRSQFPRPGDREIGQFEVVRLPQRTASSIICEHGDPYYVKIDIEFFDQYILRELHECRVRPEFISVELQNFAVYRLLKRMGYRCFNLVDGNLVEREYRGLPVVDRSGNGRTYSFPRHSAGPFGPDVAKSPWLQAWQMDVLLLASAAGWKDIHASRADLCDGQSWSSLLRFFPIFFRELRGWLRPRTRLREFLRSRAG